MAKFAENPAHIRQIRGLVAFYNFYPTSFEVLLPKHQLKNKIP
jgi:hypothetical protein